MVGHLSTFPSIIYTPPGWIHLGPLGQLARGSSVCCFPGVAHSEPSSLLLFSTLYFFRSALVFILHPGLLPSFSCLGHDFFSSSLNSQFEHLERGWFHQHPKVSKTRIVPQSATQAATACTGLCLCESPGGSWPVSLSSHLCVQCCLGDRMPYNFPSEGPDPITSSGHSCARNSLGWKLKRSCVCRDRVTGEEFRTVER